LWNIATLAASTVRWLIVSSVAFAEFDRHSAISAMDLALPRRIEHTLRIHHSAERVDQNRYDGDLLCPQPPSHRQRRSPHPRC
jgi:hypothetical protein